MSQDPVRHCPGCGQALRFPDNVGGVVMACPNCGHRFASTFKLAGAPRPATPAPQAAPVLTPTAIPTTEDTQPANRPATTTMAARVAALYASKAS